MPKWKALVQEITGTGLVWHTDVTAQSETEALRKALEIFLNTEDRYDVSLDFTTLTLRRRRLKGKRHRWVSWLDWPKGAGYALAPMAHEAAN